MNPSASGLDNVENPTDLSGEADRSICTDLGRPSRLYQALKGVASKSFIWCVGAATTGSRDLTEPMLDQHLAATTEQEEEAQYADQAKEDFNLQYRSDPEAAVAKLLQQVLRWESATAFAVSPAQAASILLPHLPGGSYGRQNLLVDALKRCVGPDAIIQSALALSRGPCDSDILQAAAGLLEHYASDAWPALDQLASSGRPESRYFVRQIAECEGIADCLRVAALASLAKNPDPDTRYEVADVLQSDSLHGDLTPAWQALATAPEESIRTLATERLETVVD